MLVNVAIKKKLNFNYSLRQIDFKFNITKLKSRLHQKKINIKLV